ncbi:MAG: DMT family transporter, partial [Chloroflexi bacterium]|nr:DMT family transporter [Chloroflexota bacterium]
MAVILLDEVVTLAMLFAIGLVLLGPAVILERRPRTSAPAASSGGAESPRATRNPLELRFLEGYVFATLAAVAYGTSPLLIRAALMDATRTAAIGTFVAYFGASAVLLATLVIPGRRQLIRAINLRYMRLFGGAGLMVFLAQLLRFFALSVADVSVVTPLQRMANVFTVILTWIFNRSLETITLRVVIGVLVSFGGSALLVY